MAKDEKINNINMLSPDKQGFLIEIAGSTPPKDGNAQIDMLNPDKSISFDLMGKEQNVPIDMLETGGLQFYDISIEGGYAVCETPSNYDLPAGCVSMRNCYEYKFGAYRAVYSPLEDNIDTVGDPYIMWIDNSTSLG